MHFFCAHWDNWFQVLPTLWVETDAQGCECGTCGENATGIEIGFGWLVFAFDIYIPTHTAA